MPEPGGRVSEVRPKQAVFAASIGGNDLMARELSKMLNKKAAGAAWQSGRGFD